MKLYIIVGVAIIAALAGWKTASWRCESKFAAQLRLAKENVGAEHEVDSRVRALPDYAVANSLRKQWARD